jgi:hypothetical protein
VRVERGNEPSGVHDGTEELEDAAMKMHTYKPGDKVRVVNTPYRFCVPNGSEGIVNTVSTRDLIAVRVGPPALSPRNDSGCWHFRADELAPHVVGPMSDSEWNERRMRVVMRYGSSRGEGWQNRLTRFVAQFSTRAVTPGSWA